MNHPLSTWRVADIGEQGLLQRLQRFCPGDIVGDDAAVIAAPEQGQWLVITTDILVDGVHFSDRTTPPQSVGYRAATANLSDLAAMGASPLGITVGLSLPGHVFVTWVEDLYQGLTQCLQEYNTPILGGDICHSPLITLSITALGQVSPQHTIRRSTAQVGDAIVVTGIHGAARAGLELLLHPELGAPLQNADQLALIQAHQYPQPRLDILPSLWAILNASYPITGMDSSDGLGDAIVQLCRESGVGAIIERSHIPFPSILPQFVSLAQAWNWILYGGEDFELVLCLSPEPAQRLVQQLGKDAAVIGYITPGDQVWLTDSTGEFPDELLTLDQGFQHF